MASVSEQRDRIEIMVPCRAEFVRTIRRTVADFAESLNMPKPSVEAIEIAISEAMANVVRHAYDGCEYRHPVKVRCARLKSGLTLEIIDKGRGFDAPPDGTIPEVDFNREGGLGIILIKSLMDQVNYVSKPDVGTKIKMLMTV